jgi:lysyl-tRNA synthetase class 2
VSAPKTIHQPLAPQRSGVDAPDDGRRPLAPRLLALGLALIALLGVASSITPALRERNDVLGSLVPGEVRSVAAGATLATSVALLIVAGGLLRRRHRSWQAAVVMVSAVAVLHLVKGLDFEEASASLLLLAGLIVWRRDFDVEGDPETPGTFRRHAVYALAGLIVLGFLLIEGQSMLAGDLLPPVQASVELLHNTFGLGPERLEGRGSTAVSRAILLYTLVAGGWLLFLWLKPRRQYVRQHTRDRTDARRIVLEAGTDTLDYFALRRDKDYFFTAARDAFIAYRVSGGVALISGDPVGRAGACPELLRSFVAFGHRHGWRIAAIGVGPDFVPTYEAAGLRTVYIGDEAVVDPREFSLEGRAIRKVRQSVHRLEKAGYTVQVLRRDELTPELLAGLLRVSQLWLGGQPERGFSMAMDDLWASEHASALFAIALAADGRPHGFIHYVPVPQARSLSLSAMRRLPETPNGLMEFVLCETFAWGREHGIERVSLNFNAFGELLRADVADLPAWERGLKSVLTRADRYFQVERLLGFNRKFFPRWEPRHAAYERRRDLPWAALVLLTAESLVAFPQGLRRLWRRLLPVR